MKYLIFETELGAKARSAQEAVNRGSNDADVTRYWWSWRETAAASWALSIPESDVSNLSLAEQSDLVDEIEWPVSGGV
jgi:hypothetical protein